MVTIYKTFSFEAAHFLPHVPEGHKCGSLHGHSYKVKVGVSGSIGTQPPNAGWVMDFGEISAVVKPLIESLDHKCLNDLDGLANPTSENLVMWFVRNIRIEGLCEVEVRETDSSAAVWRL